MNSLLQTENLSSLPVTELRGHIENLVFLGKASFPVKRDIGDTAE